MKTIITITFIYLNYFTAMREMSEDVFKNISTCFCMNKIVIIKLVIIMGASALAQHYLLHVSLTILGWEILFFSPSHPQKWMYVENHQKKNFNAISSEHCVCGEKPFLKSHVLELFFYPVCVLKIGLYLRVQSFSIHFRTISVKT